MRRDFANVGVWLLLVIAGNGVRGWAKVKPMELPVARIAADTDKATVVMRLQSDTTEKVTLSAGDVTLKETKDVLPATVTFDQASVALQPNQPAEVKVTVARMFAEGEATAEIRVQGEKLGELRIVRYGAGLRLQHTWLQFHKGRATALQMKNETQFPYTVGWMMQIGAVKVCGQGPDKPCETVENWKTVTIPAKNTAIIEVEPAAAWFDRWRPGTEQARLTLAFGQAGAQLPKVEMHFAANLAGSWSMMATKLQTLWIVLLLALGGLLSLLVRHWVPNSQRKRELKEHIHRVRQKIKGLSGEIDSVLRVLVSVELRALDGLRKSAYSIFPDYETVAAHCAKGIALLERRVDLIEEIDSIHDWVGGQWERCPPPSRIDFIYSLLQQASELLKRLQPQDKDFVDAKDLIDKAKGLLGGLMGTDTELGKELVGRLELAAEEWRELESTDEGKEVRKAVPGLFAVLTDPRPAEIPQQRHQWYDANLVALGMLRDYARLLQRSTDKRFKSRIREKSKGFLADVIYPSWDKLRAARLKLRQLQENIYVDDIVAAIKQGELTLVNEPARVIAQSPVMFSVSFRRSEMNWSAALDQVQCEWDFGPDQLKERGCTAAHYFEQAGKPTTVRVIFTDPDGKQVAVDKVEPMIVTPLESPSQEKKSRLWHEFSGLAVTLVIPLLGLMGGAQEELQKGSVMGVMGVFLMGYSADTIKGVFTQRTQAQP